MKKATFKEACVQNNNGTIVLYYFNKTKVRFNIGVTISPNKTRAGKWDEWDENKQSINAKSENYHQKINRINKWLEIANSYLRDKYKEGYIVSGDELSTYLRTYDEDREEKLFAELIPMYEQFYKRKEEDFTVSKKLQSLKDYKSLWNAFCDYEVDTSTTILIKHIDEEWLRKFMLWLAIARPAHYKKDGVLQKYKTKGQLVPKTLHKRFSCFLTFWKFLAKKKIATEIELLEDFIKTIKPLKTQKSTLFVHEIYKLYAIKFEREILNIVKDLFVFTCLTGLRHSDLKRFDYAFVKEHPSGNGFYYERKSIKTADSSGVTMRIPLFDTALDILKKYNYNIMPFVKDDATMNLHLHELLEKSEMFNGLTEEKDKKTGEYLKRFQAITWHNGRDTFITNMVYNTPLNELMIYTGHSKLSTLQGYIDFSRTIHMEYVFKTFSIKAKST